MTRASLPKIAVLGSINMDLVIRAAKLPMPGETILANSSAEFCGGKGANQAVAAALAGGEVAMIGAVGSDAFADRLVQNLEHHKIDCQNVIKRVDQPSGLAVISVDEHGQNSIMVVPGANGSLTPADIFAAKAVIQQCDVLLIQLEIPIETVLAGIQLAKKTQCRIVLDPAPAPSEIPPELLAVDLLCPNESEASALSGHEVTTVDDALHAASAVAQLGAKHVAITMGVQGTLLFNDGESQLVPAFPVQTVDTTAAGDAFAGALAVAWSLTGDLHASVRFANAAGALAASRHGAQASMAHRSKIESLLQQYS